MSQSHPKAQAEALIQRGRDLLEQGQYQAATDLLNQAVRLYWSVGEQYAAAAQIGNYGWALRRQGRPDLARPYLQEAARIFEEMGLRDFAERHRFGAEDLHPGVTEELLAGLPPAVRGALERGDVGGLQFALDALPLAQRELILERLAAAGIVSLNEGDAGAGEALQQFEPLLQGIAAVARGQQDDRDEILAALDELERKGWKLRAATLRIWQGERVEATLTAGLDALDAALVRRALELVVENAP
jgi:tetratricopeptide (TPR) repeat protein